MDYINKLYTDYQVFKNVHNIHAYIRTFKSKTMPIEYAYTDVHMYKHKNVHNMNVYAKMYIICMHTNSCTLYTQHNHAQVCKTFIIYKCKYTYPACLQKIGVHKITRSDSPKHKHIYNMKAPHSHKLKINTYTNTMNGHVNLL